MKLVSAIVFVAAFALAGFSAKAETADVSFPPGYVHENFGERVAPFEGFLELKRASWPAGYSEKSHHYTKREYELKLEKVIGVEKFHIDIIESEKATFVEPKDAPVRVFDYKGRSGRIYAYSDHLSHKPAAELVWLNAPKQRLAIYVEQTPSQEFSPDDLIRLLHSMAPAIGVPAFVHR